MIGVPLKVFWVDITIVTPSAPPSDARKSRCIGLEHGHKRLP
jgi:hypothetical protein